MKEGYTHIAVVLDSSGSMGMILEDTIGGFNTFLQAQKEAEGEATMSLAEFHYPSVYRWNGGEPSLLGRKVQVNQKFDFLDIQEVEPLSHLNYHPSGGTPLLDTIGQVIEDTGKSLAAMSEKDRPSKVLFVIITDGEENASQVYDFKAIEEKISRQRDIYKWEFVFLGANQDAIGEASKMGIGAASSLSYGTSKVAMGSTYDMLATKTAAFRSVQADASVLAFSAEERAQAMGDDVKS